MPVLLTDISQYLIFASQKLRERSVVGQPAVPKQFVGGASDRWLNWAKGAVTDWASRVPVRRRTRGRMAGVMLCFGDLLRGDSGVTV
jgi:hypothetical protein